MFHIPRTTEGIRAAQADMVQKLLALPEGVVLGTKANPLYHALIEGGTDSYPRDLQLYGLIFSQAVKRLPPSASPTRKADFRMEGIRGLLYSVAPEHVGTAVKLAQTLIAEHVLDEICRIQNDSTRSELYARMEELRAIMFQLCDQYDEASIAILNAKGYYQSLGNQPMTVAHRQLEFWHQNFCNVMATDHSTASEQNEALNEFYNRYQELTTAMGARFEAPLMAVWLLVDAFVAGVELPNHDTLVSHACDSNLYNLWGETILGTLNGFKNKEWAQVQLLGSCAATLYSQIPPHPQIPSIIMVNRIAEARAIAALGCAEAAFARYTSLLEESFYPGLRWLCRVALEERFALLN